jgi:hypothetical protein
VALAVTTRDTINSEVDAASYSGAAFTATANSLLIALIGASRGSSLEPATPTVTHDGLTLTLIDFNFWSTLGSTRKKLWIAAVQAKASPGSSALSADFGGVTHVGCEASIFDVTGSDVLNGLAQSFVQVVKSTADATGGASVPVTLTLAGAGNAANRPFSLWAHASNDAPGVTPQASWIELHEFSHANPNANHESQWRSDAFDTAAAATWSAGPVGYGGLAFEIKALVSGPPKVPKRIVVMSQAVQRASRW